MGMQPDLIAVGAYCEAIEEFLPYGAETYRRCKTRVGTKIVVPLFPDLNGSGLARKLAESLGIDDPWNFNQHVILADAVDYTSLKTGFDEYWSAGDYDRDIQALQILLENGFEVFFRPNG